MRLFIDARWVRTDFHDGISRYTAGLLEGFKQNNQEVTALIHDERQRAMLPVGTHCEIVHHPISWHELFIARKLNALGADVVFSPLQVMGVWGRKYKLILTLQDIIYYKHPKPPTSLSWYVRAVWRLFHAAKWPQRLLLNQADHVVTVSATSKQFIQEYRLTDRDITVVYNAPSIEKSENTTREATSIKDIIYMGSFMPYKNVETLICGVDLLSEEYRLHLLSKVSLERKQELLRLSSRPEKIVFHNGVSDDEYIRLLQASHCLATATKEEGFGLPITEAQKLSVPVVCSDLPVLREVAGEGALYFAPDDAEAFANAVLQLEQPTVRQQVTAAGNAHADQFTWSHSASVLYRLAQSV